MRRRLSSYRIELAWLLLLVVLALLIPTNAYSSEGWGDLLKEDQECDEPPVNCYVEAMS